MSDHYYSPSDDPDLEFRGSSSSSSSSDEDLSDLANFDDIYQDMMMDEYGLEQIDNPSPLRPLMPEDEYGAEEIIITESDISASEAYEHLNYHLEQENCNVSNNSS